jgi:hypothetical protein
MQYASDYGSESPHNARNRLPLSSSPARPCTCQQFGIQILVNTRVLDAGCKAGFVMDRMAS